MSIPSLHLTDTMSSKGGPLQQHAHSQSHLQPSQHSLHQPPGPVAAQVVGHAVGAVESGLDIEATQVLRVGLVEVKGDTSNVDPLRGLVRQAQLVARCLGESGSRVTQWYPYFPIPPHLTS